MKRLRTGMLLLLLAWASVPAQAQFSLYKPFTSLRVIKTARFDIIFPKESEPSARLLASYADRVYEQVSTLLGIEVPVRIPVSFTPHTGLFNGHYNPVSSPHIVLFDTPMDIEWTSFADNLESLFLHELTHAVSLNTRSPFYRVLHRIFGNWVTPTFYTAPQFMVEGVTVSFESLSGFGRANDPLVKQNLRQAIHEDKFLTPFQASGVYDLPMQGTAYYEYGGLFSAWLQQRYGMEKYAELWQLMGYDRYAGFSLFVYRSDYYRVFKKVYNMDFMDAWNAFSVSFAPGGLEENTEAVFQKQYHFFSEKKRSIDALAAEGNSVYALEGRAGKVHVYDTRAETMRIINTDAVTAYDLDVNAGGAALLVSGFRYIGDRYTATVTEHKTDTGRKTGRYIEGLYRARYFRDGVIGIRAELHNTCIVYEDFNGTRETLLRGNEGLMFSGPQAVDNERIAFIAVRGGTRELWLYNYVSGELFCVENVSGENEYWPYMRGLSVSEGKLFFTHNADDRMYKLASVDLEAMQAVYSGRDFSGGVFSPVSADNAVYYRGAFFSGDSLLRFPETAASLSGKQSELKLVRLDKHSYEEQHVSRAGNVQAAVLGPSKPYHAIRYMSPFNFWLPLPLIRFGDTAPITLDGGGLVSVMADPSERNLITAMAFADIRYKMANVGMFTWQNTSLGFPITLDFTDTVAGSGSERYRDTRGTLNGSVAWNMGRWSSGFSLGGLYVRFADYESGKSAYEWGHAKSVFALSAGLAFSNRYRRTHELFGTGLSLNLRGASTVNAFEPQVMGMFRASAETRFPLHLALYGAYDKQGMGIDGVSAAYGRPVFTGFASTEYVNPDISLNWLTGAEASVGIFSFEIQRNLSHIYMNRFYGTLSLRNVLYDSKGNPKAEGIEINDMRLAQSLVCKLGMVFSFLPLKQVPVSIEPVAWGAWKLSNTITGKGSPWYITAGLSINLP